VSYHQDAYAQSKNQQFLLSGALNRMRNFHLSKAWERWQEWYAEMMDQKFRLAGALKRMMQRQLSMAWEKWQWVTAVMKHGLQNRPYVRGQKWRQPPHNNQPNRHNQLKTLPDTLRP
jgi:hypothetical protein